MELLMIEIPEEFIGIVTQLLSPRKGKMRSDGDAYAPGACVWSTIFPRAG